MFAPSRTIFRKSSYSVGDRENCVEVADLPGGAAIRDSRHPDRGYLAFGTAEWRAFLDGVRRGQL